MVYCSSGLMWFVGVRSSGFLYGGSLLRQLNLGGLEWLGVAFVWLQMAILWLGVAVVWLGVAVVWLGGMKS